MLSKKEREERRMLQDWANHERSATGRQSAEWTLAQMCLAGTATDEQYNSLEKCYASYDGDGFTYVGPSFGPYKITGLNAFLAWNRVTGKQNNAKAVYEGN